jgi:hypothetical protein
MTRRLMPLIPGPGDPAGRRAHALRDGYLYAPRLLREATLAPLRALVDGALTRRGWLRGATTDPALRLGRWDDPRWLAFLGEILPSEPYRALAAAPELLDVLRDVLGGEPEPHAGDVCRLVSPAAPELTTPPHQDAAYLKDATAAGLAPPRASPARAGRHRRWRRGHRRSRRRDVGRGRSRGR